jgi:phage portal protein BeeE
MSVTLDPSVGPDKFREFVAAFKDAHQGADKAYKPLFLAGGADVRVLSSDFRQMDFKALQGLSETRIAMAAGVHPTVVGMSEGLQGSSLNSGNFNAAARLVANTTMRPLWRNVCSSLQSLVAAPAGAELWYDDRDIAFLREDGTDLAQIRTSNAAALRSLVDGGFQPDAAVEYIQTNDLNRLKGRHTGLLPVQLQTPGSGSRPGASSNGSINGSQAPVPR